MTPLQGTGGGAVTTQSEGWSGQRFIAFLVTAIIITGQALLFAKVAVVENVQMSVIQFTCMLGASLILGRTFVHVMEAWASTKLGGKVESKTVTTESTIVKEPPK